MKFSAKKRTPSPSPSTASASTNPTSNTTSSRITPIQTPSYPLLTTREPSPRNNNNNASVSPEILSLTLENSSLKSQLALLLDASPGSESTLELSNLLQLANEKNDSLQHKVDELHGGLKEIEKERRLLKQSVVRDRESYLESSKRAQEEIEAMRSLLTQESKRLEMLEGELAALQEFEYRARQEMDEQKRYSGMRDKELSVLQARVGEQERRIEVLVEEGLDLKKKIGGLEVERSKLEGDCEELAGELENVRLELKEARVEIDDGVEREAGLTKEVVCVNSALEKEKADRATDRHNFEAKESVLRDELSQLEILKQQKEDKIHEMTKLLKKADLQKRELEHTVQAKNEVITSLQTQIDHSESSNQSLRNDLNKAHREMEQMSIAHEEIVTQKDAEMQTLQEQKQAVGDELVAANNLRQGLEAQIESQSKAQAELSVKYDDLETENGELATELDGTKRIIASLETEFENTREQVDKIQRRAESLEEELYVTKERLSASQDETVSLKSHMELMQATHADELAHASKCRAELEAGLKIEVDTCNELRSRLEKMEIRLKQEAEAHQKAIQSFDRQIESEKSRFCSEIEMLKKEHQAQIEENETTGAAVIEELEESIDSLNKKIAHDNAEHEHAVKQLHQTISRVHTENETLERQVAEYEKQTLSQEEKIAQLHNLSQHRGEEIIVLQKELSFHRDSMEITKRDHLKAIDVLSTELDDVRLAHQNEIDNMQYLINDLGTQLAAANAKLETEDEELNITKTKLTERTQLLKEMMGQIKTYKSQYEDECGRTKQLTDALERAKSELNVARTRARHYEEEKNDQENQFREAMRKERQQRKAIEKQVESFDDVRKKYNEMEKENFNLKDKITRQENYISKLHDRQEKDRRRAAAPLGVSKANRPSTAPMSPPKVYSSSKRSGSVAKKRHYTVQEVMQGQSFTSNKSMSEDGRQNENQQPKHVIPQSMDESDFTTG
ncbi:hypothetical protein ACHAXN_001907 [Cyclotella atomus]